MLGTEWIVNMYLLGFGAVWVGVLTLCCAAGIVGHRRHNWDRAVAKELLAAPTRELPTPTPGSPGVD